VVHDRQGLPLGLETGHHLPRVHARLEDLQRHLAANRFGLLGQENDAKSALADPFEQLVRADRGTGAFGDLDGIDGAGRRVGVPALNAAHRLVGLKELIDSGPKLGVAAAGLVQERGPLGRGARERVEKNRAGLVFDCSHETLAVASPRRSVRRSVASFLTAEK
jgi:hypothetical protein